MKRIPYLASLAVALSLLPAWHDLWAQGAGHMETIYSFEAPPGATYPAAGPIISESGALYGTTSEGGTTVGCGYFHCGTVYELVRPASPGGAWTETTLYSFKNNADGYGPTTGLVFGANGTLYGLSAAGCCGAVFALTPPASPNEAWTETTIYSFKGPPSDGGQPTGPLAIGGNGLLYGTTRYGGTYNQGTVFDLTPTASSGDAWTPSILYSFRGDGDGIYPDAGVVIGDNGVIYGTTLSGGAMGDGTVFGLELVAGVWEEKVLVSMDGSMNQPGTLALGHKGSVYGQTPDDIFKVVPPAAEGEAWTVQSLYPVYIPQSMTIAATGAIYWTTPYGGTSTACGVSSGCGTLSELVPPASPSGMWTMVVLHNWVLPRCLRAPTLHAHRRPPVTASWSTRGTSNRQ